MSDIETSRVHPPTDYAKSGDIHVAYQFLGEGPVNLVFVPGFVSHVEHFWEDPSLARFTCVGSPPSRGSSSSTNAARACPIASG